MTEATMQALDGLRDVSALEWYVVPLLAIVCYIYTREIHKAQSTKNWDAVFCGLAVFGTDFFNETWNGWVMVLSGRSALWTAPGKTALRTLVGWNIEIMFMFLLLGIVYYYSLSETRDKKILKIPEMWFWGIVYSVVCVLIENILNFAGLLVWEYPFWNRSFAGVWSIFFIGYLIFFCSAIWVLTRRTTKKKLIVLGVIYTVPILMNIIGQGILGWKY